MSKRAWLRVGAGIAFVVVLLVAVGMFWPWGGRARMVCSHCFVIMNEACWDTPSGNRSVTYHRYFESTLLNETLAHHGLIAESHTHDWYLFTRYGRNSTSPNSAGPNLREAATNEPYVEFLHALIIHADPATSENWLELVRDPSYAHFIGAAAVRYRFEDIGPYDGEAFLRWFEQNKGDILSLVEVHRR